MAPVHALGAPRPKSPQRANAIWIWILVVCLSNTGVLLAQAVGAPAQAAARPAASVGADSEASEVELLVGRSAVLNVPAAIQRVSLTSPDIADVMVTSPNQVLVHGKTAGTISMFLWERSGAIRRYELVVRRDLSELSVQYRNLFPGENITVGSNGKNVVLSGTVSTKYVIDKAADVAVGFVEKKENVVNLLQQQEGVASNQVLLRVRFAEVSRSALQELGASFFANAYKNDWFGRTQPPGVPGPDFDSERGLVFSDFLNLFVFNSKEGLGAVVKALATRGLFQSLAEPNLIATNGKEASFLAGGEYPYPVAQASGGGTTVTIQFKEFGIRLNFTPTVLGGDLIHLKVRPEVSALDFANAVSLEGFRIPALSTRRTETEVELRDGQTFAIAGLMNNTLTQQVGKIPGIGDIPILGLLFKSRAYQKNQTELVVMITPTIMKRGQMGASEGMPTLLEPYLGRPNRVLPSPEPHLGSPKYPVNPSSRSGGRTTGPEAAAAGSSQPATTTAQPAPAPTTTPTPQPAGSKIPPRQQSAAPDPSTAPRTGSTVAPAPQPVAASPQSVRQPQAAPQPPFVPQPEVATAPAPPQLTREQQRAVERAREQERKAAAEEARRQAEAQQVAQRKAEEDKRQADKLAKEKAKRDAELARKKAEEDQKRGKALAEAALKLKEAQAAYQSEVEKANADSSAK
ncbi:MAG TPA: pilus assembly protein N-terminal domain-containing protein [Vicinamibacterales bacterium]|jgi:pilus assembly protein CpaC